MSDEQLDPDFVTFKSPEFGIRAMCRILFTYESRGDNTVRKIINAWAPPSENDTGAYVTDVAKRCGVSPDDVLDVDQAEVMRNLVSAIIVHENGAQPYSARVLDDGMRLAGVSDMDPAPVMASKTSQGATIAGVGTGIAALTEAVHQAQDVRDTISQTTDLVHWALSYGPWVAVACAVAGLSLFFYGHLRKRQHLGV